MTRHVTRLGRRPKVVVYSLLPVTHACAIIRLLSPMVAENWDVIWASKWDGSGWSFDVDIARTADLIVIQRQFPAIFTEKVLQAILSFKVPIAYDLDDMFLDVSEFHPDYNELIKHVPYIEWMLKEVDLVTVSTPYLRESLKKYTTRPIHVLPNLVDWTSFDARPRPQNNQFNFLISGTPTHQSDWSIIEEPLAEILNVYRNDVKAIFFGAVPQRFTDHPSVRLIDFQADYKQYAARLRALDIHAALVPLEDTKFNQCKSNIKWLEYTAAGMPGAYSDITPYRSSISHAETGLLVTNTADSWFHAMDYLLANPEAVSSMIESARRKVREQYSIENISGEYTSFFHDLLGRKHDRRIFSGLSTLPTRLGARAYRSMNKSAFLGKHVMWRLNRKQ